MRTDLMAARVRLGLAAVVVLACLVALTGQARAGGLPTSDPLYQKHKDQLEKEVTLKERRLVLGELTEQLTQQSGMDVILDVEEVPGLRTVEVKLDLPKLKMVDALEQVCAQTQTSWDIQKSKVVITSRKTIAWRNRETRAYDLRPLLTPGIYARHRMLALNETIDEPGLLKREPTCFAGYRISEHYAMNRDERIRTITSFIMDTAGESQDWVERGGTWYKLHEFNDKIVVTAPKVVLEQVEKSLKMIEPSIEQLAVDLRCLAVEREVLDKELNLSKPILDARQTEELLAKLKKLSEEKVQVLGSWRNVIQNNEPAQVEIGEEGLMLKPATQGQPNALDLGVCRTGLSIALQGVLALDGQAVTVSVAAEYVPEVKWRSAKVMLVPSEKPLALHLSGTTKAASPKDAKNENESGTTLEGTLTPPPPGAATLTTIDLPTQSIIKLNTKARIPVGGCVVLTASTTAFAPTRPGSNREVVLIVRLSAL